MRTTNIASLYQIKNQAKEETLKAFLNLHNIKIKSSEIDDIGRLVETLVDAGCGLGHLSDFFVGYSIPQIGKEFDLLKFSKKIILNIEIKSESSLEKIEAQLLRNRYYLESVGRKVENFSFISSTSKLYHLTNKNQVVELEINELANLLCNFDCERIDDLDSLFNPSEFLVSPFNSTEKFLENQYFLTSQQEEIRGKINTSLRESTEAKFFSLSGGPGTGKTLLIYDIAKQSILAGKKVLIVHCGILNIGHTELNKNNFTIIAVKALSKVSLDKFDLIILDECQRLYSNQLDSIVEAVKNDKKCCIFSHDSRQTLAESERSQAISSRILSIKDIKHFNLSEKIRSNAEIANFIKLLMNNARELKIPNLGNIEINYFGDITSAESYLTSLDGSFWELLRFTPSQYKNEYHESYFKGQGQTSHEIIGQEFDNIAVVIDQFFRYDKLGNLSYFGTTYYDAARMLFQNITRAKRRLNIIIVKNEEMLRWCSKILHS